MKKYFLLSLILLLSSALSASQYEIDTSGGHAAINFKIQHLGYSWLTGRFNNFEGHFNYDANNEALSNIEVSIDVTSLDSNHAERDKHLRGKKFLNTSKYPSAKFTSTGFNRADNMKYQLMGKLELNGVTRDIIIEVKKIGEGDDPWGGYRVGFEGSTQLKLTDFNVTYDLGPASTYVLMELYIEGVTKK